MTAGKSRSTIIAAAALVLAAACAREESPTMAGTPSPSAAPPTVSVASPAEGAEIGGNVVTLTVTSAGILVKPADGDTSGSSGHYHAFVDREPVAPGQAIPMEPGIIHFSTATVPVTGLSPGEHTITVVLGDGAHNRLGEAASTVKVRVTGPSVKASAPSSVKAGEPVTVNMEAEGVRIVSADGDSSGRTGHFHIFVDPVTQPTANGQVIPAGDPKIIHTAEKTATVTGLEPGPHTLWVVLGNGLHVPFDPLVADKVSVTVTE